jgi:hypothetical protein
VVGFGKGVGEGVVGIGEGGLMLYRLSAANYILDRDSSEQAWSDMERTVEFARENPGEFGKAVINWDDLSHGRYGEWLGNLAPDAALAFFTAGSGTVATRGVRAADTAGDVAQAARTADRVGDAAPGGGASRAAHLTDLRTQAAGAGVEVPHSGMLVERTYGQSLLDDGTMGGSGPFGESWAPAGTIERLAEPRGQLGLPEFNGGRFVVTGRLDDPTSVLQIRRAVPWNGPGGYFTPGGAPEYVIPDADLHIEVLRVRGVNPDF